MGVSELTALAVSFDAGVERCHAHGRYNDGDDGMKKAIGEAMVNARNGKRGEADDMDFT